MIKYLIVLFHYCLILFCSAKTSYWIMRIHEYPVFEYIFIFYFVYVILFFILCVVLSVFWTLLTVVGSELGMYWGMRCVAFLMKRIMKLDRVELITSMYRVNLRDIQFKLFCGENETLIVFDMNEGFVVNEELQQICYKNRVKQSRLSLCNIGARSVLNFNRIFSEYNKLFNV